VRVTALEIAHRLREEQKGQQKWAGQHFGTIDDGDFMAVAINKKEFVLSPYPEMTALVYRGQKQYYEPCKSSFYRTSPNQIDLFIAEMKVAEFHLLLSEHPAVVDFGAYSLMGLRFRIDYEGLAQHYGLQTQLIDFTSNPFVAAFFACCDYDNNSHEYRPILRAAQEGIIYTYLAAGDIGNPAGPEEPCPSIVGLQPLPRPAEQYAWCYRLPKWASLNSQPYVKRLSFVHDPGVSKKLFEHFEGGARLFPYDPVSEKARQIFSTKEFTKGAFRMALAKGGGAMKERSTLALLSRKGITVIDEPKPAFTIAEKAEIEKDWSRRKSALVSRIHWRRTSYPQ
jgi:hypothetical protein